MSVFGSLFRASPEPPADDELAAARVAVARRLWEEIPQTRLVARSFGRLIDAESDRVYSLCRGTIFERGSARLIDERTGLAFYVDPNGWPIALERHTETWSAIVERRAS